MKAIYFIAVCITSFFFVSCGNPKGTSQESPSQPAKSSGARGADQSGGNPDEKNAGSDGSSSVATAVVNYYSAPELATHSTVLRYKRVGLGIKLATIDGLAMYPKEIVDQVLALMEANFNEFIKLRVTNIEFGHTYFYNPSSFDLRLVPGRSEGEIEEAIAAFVDWTQLRQEMMQNGLELIVEDNDFTIVDIRSLVEGFSRVKKARSDFPQIRNFFLGKVNGYIPGRDQVYFSFRSTNIQHADFIDVMHRLEQKISLLEIPISTPELRMVGVQESLDSVLDMLNRLKGDWAKAKITTPIKSVTLFPANSSVQRVNYQLFESELDLFIRVDADLSALREVLDQVKKMVVIHKRLGFYPTFAKPDHLEIFQKSAIINVLLGLSERIMRGGFDLHHILIEQQKAAFVRRECCGLRQVIVDYNSSARDIERVLFRKDGSVRPLWEDMPFDAESND